MGSWLLPTFIRECLCCIKADRFGLINPGNTIASTRVPRLLLALQSGTQIRLMLTACVQR